MVDFYTYIYRALHICSDPPNHSNELNYLKSLVLSQGFNTSVIGEALNKLKKPKYSVCHSNSWINPVVLSFYFSISL